MIGVFDSGHGGLTILRGLIDRLPERSFLYFGDHRHLPYGDRSSAEIVAYTRDAVDLLFQRGCRLVILACNTAAAVALRTLQQEWLAGAYPGRRILGVLVPTIEAITGAPWTAVTAPSRRGQPRTVAIFATRRTVASNAYVEEIGKRAPEIAVVQQSCAGLVEQIETHAPRAEIGTTIATYADALTASLAGRIPDAVLLGCTHYPLVADLFAAAMPAGCPILSQPRLVASSLADYLRRHPTIDEAGAVPSCRFLTSGDPAAARRSAALFFGTPAPFEAA